MSVILEQTCYAVQTSFISVTVIIHDFKQLFILFFIIYAFIYLKYLFTCFLLLR